MQGNVEKINKPTHYICFDYIKINDKPAVICHIDIYKWNKTTKKEILKDIKEVADAEPLDKYVVWNGVDNKFLKFITMVGFVDTGCYVDEYGVREYMYIYGVNHE